MRKRSLEVKKFEINKYFNAQHQKVYKISELSRIFDQQRERWNLAPSLTLKSFIHFLNIDTSLSIIELELARKETRYVWGVTSDS